MNIREAKEEIIRTVNAYRRKDDAGAYEIPPEQQRPILLMGPPGIGKTAIMEQIASACGIGLVSYTITHHTRQSAIGLPMIAEKQFDGVAHSVTEYTMSEIVASVYDQIARTGIREGILFLDEINCVSETLAPTMLQFLQYKMFGTHKVPEGWIIVTAGTPPQYNRAARDFDIVTLDRVKKMEITADFEVWKEYAYRAGIHGAVLSYLEVKPQHFYFIRTELDGRHFVTARGWEDLSRMIASYEKMGEPVTEQMTIQYLQDAEIARDFAMYYELYRKYSEQYRVKDILAGMMPPEPEQIRNVPFDEKLSLMRLLAEMLHQEFMKFDERRSVQEKLYEQLLAYREELSGQTGLQGAAPGSERDETPEDDAAGRTDAVSLLRARGEKLREELQIRLDASMISREEERRLRLTCIAWDELVHAVILDDASGREADPDQAFAAVKEWFTVRETARQQYAGQVGEMITNAFAFLTSVYGTGQEIVMFLTELNADWYCLQYISTYGNEAYEKYNRMLLLRDRQESLRQEILAFS